MTALLPSSGDREDRLSSDPLRLRTLQTYFLDDETAFFKSPVPEYYEAEYSTTSPPFSRHSSSLSSYTPTLSSVSLDATPDREDEVALPTFDGEESPDLSRTVGASSPGTELSSTTAIDKEVTDPSHGVRGDSDAAGIHRSAGDDSSILEEPERHVDYLSHNWREEDIWSSWRYVASRKSRYSNGVRLENASWRTWAKSKYKLNTVSPETLNWLKDCDVTWLYGPLQTDSKRLATFSKSPPPSRLSSTNSFLDRKSILKKKTASEAMLQRSLSQHTLLKHAGAILQAQTAEYTRGRPTFGRASSSVDISLDRRLDYRFTSTGSTSSNSTSSGLISPNERRHIHFNNEVVQCIAVEAKDDEDHEHDPSAFFLGPDDYAESDDGVVMMKQLPPKATISNRSTPRSSFSSESKTIAPLPSTTLKYRGDTPELPPWSQNPQGCVFGGGKLSPSPSVETLRPSRPEANFLLDDEDDDPIDWKNKRSRFDCTHDRPSFVNPEDEEELGNSGDLHRTPSGMFMPYEEGESSYTGVFGKVVDTVNTARDIAHVIWNVGWRR